MLEFIILMIILDLLLKIPAGEFVPVAQDNASAHTSNDEWEFENVDDCMEFRELRKGGWRGTATDFYRMKEEDEI